MNIVEWLANNWVEVVAAVAAVAGTARLIVKLTPTPKDDAIVAKVIDALKHLGLVIKDPPK